MILSYLFFNIGVIVLIYFSSKKNQKIRFKEYDLKNLQFLVIVLILIVLKYIIIAKQWGDWDAWSIWNLHAKFLSNNVSFQNYYDQILSYSHLDYPKLLPAIVALGWKATVSDSYLVPFLISVLILLSILIVICDFISDMKFQLPVVIIFLLDDTFMRISASQYADTMLAFLIVLSIASYIEFQNNYKKNSLIKLLILLLLSSLVKNEGLVFALIFLILLVWKLKKTEQLNKYFNLLFLFSFLYIIEIVDKIFFTISNDIVSVQSASLIYKLIDSKRYIIIFKYLFGQLFFDYKILILIMFCYVSMQKIFKLVEIFYLLIFVFASYFLVYLITPHDLIWHLSTSINRLLHHVYPALIFIFFYSLSNSQLQNRNIYFKKSNM